MSLCLASQMAGVGMSPTQKNTQRKKIICTLGWHFHARFPHIFRFSLGISWGLVQVTSFAWQCTGPPLGTPHIGQLALSIQSTSMYPSTHKLLFKNNPCTGQAEGHAHCMQRAFRTTSMQAHQGSPCKGWVSPASVSKDSSPQCVGVQATVVVFHSQCSERIPPAT